jgi:ABC-type nitrate/sulfonate/bicarbonate transport system permease component
VNRFGSALLRAAALLLVWELIGRLQLIGAGALPPPSLILQQLWLDRALYPPHVLATALPAAEGFLIGNLIAVAAALGFQTWPRSERLLVGCSVTLFAIPAIALAPVLVVTLPGTWPQIALAAVSVYFPTMSATLLGLREADSRLLEVVHSYGGGRGADLHFVRWPSCLPMLLSGLRVAAPAALLGAILAEFGSGARWGLGSFLLGSMGQANPSRLWGIGLVATALAASAYGVFSGLSRRLVGTTLPVTIAVSSTRSVRASEPIGLRLVILLGAAVLPLLAWQGLLAVSHLSPIVAPTPLDLLHYLTTGQVAEDARATLLGALAQSLPVAALGLALGLGSALAVAALGFLKPRLVTTLMPLALLLQSMPLVALTPLIVLLFGRDLLTTVVVTLSVTFFAAFITIAQGLTQTPRAAQEVLAVYGASRLQTLWLAALPACLPNLCMAARLVAPRALLGVMMAEWLATGRGLGNLLNQSRGELDYGMIWTVAAVSAAVSIAFYLLVQALEQRIRARMI